MEESLNNLEPEDRMILDLYVNQRLPWKEVVLVMADASPVEPPPHETATDARVRERLNRIKERIARIEAGEGGPDDEELLAKDIATEVTREKVRWLRAEQELAAAMADDPAHNKVETARAIRDAVRPRIPAKHGRDDDEDS